MKIHLITNLFHPDELAGAALYTDLALYLKERGDDVRITTTFSYYPAWKVRDEDRGVSLRDETFACIPVRRVRMYVPQRPTGLNRILSDLSFFWSLVIKAPDKDWQPDVVITASPMLSQCLAQRFLYVGKNVPRMIIVQDFVVDAALELKFLNVPGLAQLLFWIERWAFESAGTLVTISPGMIEKLRSKIKNSRRTVLLPNWIHGSLQSEIKSQAHTPEIRQRATLLYSGNVGVKQGLTDFVSDFKSCDSEWSLKIHGGGAEASALRTRVADAQSIKVCGVLEQDEYVRELRRATACLVTQKPGVGANFLPSKLLPALATGTPVLAVCERSSPLGTEVIAGGFGEVVEPGNTAMLTAVLKKWGVSPPLLADMSRKALSRAELYSREKILAEYARELENLIGTQVVVP